MVAWIWTGPAGLIRRLLARTAVEGPQVDAAGTRLRSKKPRIFFLE